MKFPVIIKDGKSTITFTSNDHGIYESGAACMSTLEDMMVRVNSGKASISTNLRKDDINTLKDIAEDVRYFRKLALRPTLAAICQKIFDAGFDCRNQFAARRVLSARDLGYWQEFIACALPSDWLVWAAEDVSHHMKIEMTEYYNEALNALRKIQQPGNGHI